MATDPQEPTETSGTPLSPASEPPETPAAAQAPAVPEPSSVACTDETVATPVTQPETSVGGSPEPGSGDRLVNPSEDHPSENAAPLADEAARNDDEETTGSAAEPTLEDIAAKAARRRLNARDESLALDLVRATLLTGRVGVTRVLSLAASLPWVVLVNASASAWSGLKPTARAQFLKGLGKVEGEGFVRTRMSIIRGLWKADAGAASKAIFLLFKDFIDLSTGLLPTKEAIQFGNVFLGRGRPWIASADISSLKAPEQELIRLGIFSACIQTPQAPPVVIYAMRTLMEAQLLEKLTPQQLELGERAVSKMSSKWQRALLDEVPNLPEVFRGRLPNRQEPSGSASPANGGESSPSESEQGQLPLDGSESDGTSIPSGSGESGSGEFRRERPVYISKTIPSKAGESRVDEKKAEERRAEEPREERGRDDRNRRGRETQPEPRKAAGPFNPAEALRQLDTYIQGLRVELSAAQVRLRQKDEDARRRRPERRSASVPGDQSAEELYRQVRQLEVRNTELQAQIEEFRSGSEVRGVGRGLVDGVVPEDAAAELRRVLSVTLREDFEDFEALKRDAKDVVVQRYFGSLLQHIFEVLRDEGILFEGLTPGVETKEQIIESQAALKAVDIVPLVLDEPDDEDLEELDVLDAKAEDLEEAVPELDGTDEDDHSAHLSDEELEDHPDEADGPVDASGTEAGPLDDTPADSITDHEVLRAERAFSDEPSDHEPLHQDVLGEPVDATDPEDSATGTESQVHAAGDHEPASVEAGQEASPEPLPEVETPTPEVPPVSAPTPRRRSPRSSSSS